MRWPLPWPKSGREKAPSTEAPEDEDEEKPKSLKESVLLFVRDLIVAFVIVAIVMGVLFASTRVWPPMVVVESDSMQHSDTQSSIGVIDTGDLVLVQAVGSSTDVVTYVEGRAAGYQTYSDFGDVIIFNRVGDPPGATPILHRPMVQV